MKRIWKTNLASTQFKFVLRNLAELFSAKHCGICLLVFVVAACDYLELLLIYTFRFSSENQLKMSNLCRDLISDNVSGK